MRDRVRGNYFRSILILLLFLLALFMTYALQGAKNSQPSDAVAKTDTIGTTDVDASSSDDSVMKVHFLDVGQGDCTLIQCDGKAMLIDCGDSNQGTKIQNYLKKQGITELEYLILTHPDADHIGGAPVILTKFTVVHLIMPDYEKDTTSYEKLMQAINSQGHTVTYPEVNEVYPLGSAEIRIVGPVHSYMEPNNESVSCIIKYQKNSFLFTGDAEEEAENDMLLSGAILKADVYKAGHHGSSTSTSDAFLDAVKPSCAVISCAEGNDYGHPHAQILNKLRANGIDVYRTDEDGTIIATSDGSTITWNVPPSDSWKSGE